MIVCPICKENIEEDARFCDQCGFKLRFCTECGRPGKGNRCTFCGGLMYSPADNDLSTHSTNGETTEQAKTQTSKSKSPVKGISVPQLFLVNTTLNICIEGKNGAIIGRKKGPYHLMLGNFSYVSGAHAQLKYDVRAGWSIVDLNSTNGTLLNQNQLISGVPTSLPNGGKLQIANIELNIEIR